MKQKNQDKGITLIALVITIVVLLILAGITIAALSGENGILNRATEAKQNTEEAEIQETETVGGYEEVIDNYMGVVKLKDTENTKPATAMPTGATVVEADPSKGIVIKDSKNNEWVWIEVPKTTVFTSAQSSIDYNNIKANLISYATDYREGASWRDEWYDGCGIADSRTYTTTYRKMLSSVYTNGGFWIGRYEAGVSNTNPRTASGEITGLEAKSQADMYPFNYVTCSQAQTLASAMSTDSNKTSSLMFGIQWDLVCKYLEGKDGLAKADINSDSYSWGNYNNIAVPITSANAKQRASDETWSMITEPKPQNSSVLLSTGASNNTKKMNIYDFAGNEYEWTLEHATSSGNSPCADRGGGYDYDGSGGPASGRNDGTTSYSGDDISFRPSLY